MIRYGINCQNFNYILNGNYFCYFNKINMIIQYRLGTITYENVNQAKDREHNADCLRAFLSAHILIQPRV